MKAFLVIVGIFYFVAMIFALAEVARGEHPYTNKPIVGATAALFALLFGGLLIYFSFSAAKMMPYLSVDQKTMGTVFRWFLLALGIHQLIGVVTNLHGVAKGKYKSMEKPFPHAICALMYFVFAIGLFYFVWVHPFPKF